MVVNTVPNIIKSSFFIHGMDEKRHIISLYNETTIEPQDFALLDTKKLAKQRGVLLTQLAFYQQKLEKTNPAIFGFLSDKQQRDLEQQLLFTFYLLYAQYQLDTAEKRKRRLRDLQEQMNLCAKHIEKLRNSAVLGEEVPYEKDLQEQINQSDKSLQLLGLTVLAKWMVEKIRQISENKTGTLNDWLSEINNVRLYWVWGGGMLNAALEFWADNSFHKTQATNTLAAVSKVTGYMSWLLYYTRFGINLFLLVSHTLGPWFIESEESQIPMWERFKTQWNQRKYALLNDSIWGLANMITFFWLTGSGMLGYAGNLVTVGLLCMDLVLTTWRFWEEWTKHNQEMQAFQRDRAALLALKPFLNEEDYETQLAALNKMEAKASFEWKYNKYELINAWMYALGLMLTFGIACCFFFPPAILAPATAMVIGLIGATLCFVVTVANAAVTKNIIVAKSHEEGHRAWLEAKLLLDKFNALDENEDDLKRQLYLEIKGLMADSDYQRRVVGFQAIKLLRSVLIDGIVPFVIFSSLMFLPLGIGLGVLAAGLAVVVISHVIINRFEPQQEQLPDFNEWEYAAFESNPKLEHFAEKKKRDSSFFRKNKEEIDPNYVDLGGGALKYPAVF